MSNTIYSREQGSGPAVVLISGLGGLAAFWEPVVALLRDDYRVITFDHPGVGQSGIDGLPNIPGIADALLGILDDKDIQRAHLVGHSTGSLVAQTLALDHPERVASVVLSSGWARPDKRFEDFFAYRKYLLERLGGTAYNALTRLVAYPSSFYGEHFAEAAALDFDQPSTLDTAMTQARMDMLLGYSRRAELPSLKLPVAVIGAADDYVIPFHHSQELAAVIPGARLHELSGGHFAPVTRTQPYTVLLRQFWEAQT
ncbi:alpha/beta fold hydrolase [Pseudomonas sp. NPDC090202]|uniref:alpha/beta fold hydrolase n=1 Tax=unclassified Pseudomonas TaxID=196821 RepID=UPI00381DD79F